MGLITKLTAISTAIGQKTGEPGKTYTLDEMPTAISQIQTEFPEVENPTPKIVKFIDYDGTVVANFSYDELQELSQLPELPTHSDLGLAATGWTSTLAQVKATPANGILNVGALYAPVVPSATGDASVITINALDGLTIDITIKQDMPNGVMVDWGDGTAPETISDTDYVTFSHLYSDNRFPEHDITFTPIEGCSMEFGSGVEYRNIFGDSFSNIIVKKAAFGKAKIGNYAFTSMKINEVIFSSFVDSIGSYAFNGAQGIEKIILPSSITRISERAFESSSIQEVLIPTSITEIGESAFSNCQSLRSIIIPSSVTSFGNACFMNSYIEKVILCEGITQIGQNMFSGTRLKEITIPSSITHIGAYAFSGCRNLEKVLFANNNNSVIIDSSVFYECVNLKEINLDALSNLQMIGVEVFFLCLNLKELYMPNSLTSVAENLMRYTGITTINIPTAMTWPSYSIFNEVLALRKIIFNPMDLSGWGHDQWMGWNNNVECIDFTSFESVPTLSLDIFAQTRPYAKIVVPDDLYEEWIIAPIWDGRASQIVKESEHYPDRETLGNA